LDIDPTILNAIEPANLTEVFPHASTYKFTVLSEQHLFKEGGTARAFSGPIGEVD